MGAVIGIVVMAIVVLGGWALWMKFGQKGFAAKYAAGYEDAKKFFDENEQAIDKDYFSDLNKYGLIKEVIADEEIVGIASVVEPKSVGKALLSELKTTVTNVRKVNMDLFFMVLTDKNLHFIESNGKNIVEHQVFALENVEAMSVGKGGGMNIKDAMTGASGDFHKLKFTYKGQEYSYNLYKYLYGYPRFDVHKDTVAENFYRTFMHDGMESASMKSASKESLLDSLWKTKYYDAFRAGLGSKFRFDFPA